MKSFNAEFTRKTTNDDGSAEIVFTVKSYIDKEIIKELEKGALYTLKTAPVKAKRSIEQNNYLWALIHEISVADNTELATSNDDWDVYLEALERAQAKFEYIRIKPEGIPLLKEHFRAVRELNRFTTEKGVEMVQCKVFYGSSKMNISEMAKLLDTVLDMASERGVTIKETTYE